MHRGLKTIAAAMMVPCAMLMHVPASEAKTDCRSILAGLGRASTDKPQCKFTDPRGNLLPSMTAIFVLHQKYEIYRDFDYDCDGHLNDAETCAFEASQQPHLDDAQTLVERAATHGQWIHVDKDGNPSRVLVADPPAKPPETSGWHFLLRDSAEDIGIFAQPKEAKSAAGASLGYSSDNAASNISWTAKGVATAYYHWLSKDDSAGVKLLGLALGPVVSFNRLTNSASTLKSKQLNVLSYGGVGELGIGSTFLGDQYLRLKGVVNSDFEFVTKSWSATAEWQPYSRDFKLSYPIPFGPMLLRIDPILRGQTLQRLNGSQDPVFAEHDSVWRFGPKLAFTISPKPDEVGDIRQGFLPKWLQSAAFNLSYDALYDTYTGHQSNRLNTSLIFPIGMSNNIAAKLSYQRGELEETGQWVDQGSIGLTLKW